MLGYSRDDLTAGSLRWADMTPPEWSALDHAAIEQLKRSGAARPWEKEYLHKNGSRVPVMVGVALVETGTGIAFVLDLSPTRRAEQARDLAETALGKAEERLRQSQKMEAIGTLAGSIAHDFNNLLSVILGYVESLIGDLRPGDPMRADLEEIGRAGKRAEELTRQLLAFSRRQILQPKILDLNLAISEMARMLERIIGEDIELAFLPAPSLGAVYVDPGQIEQVLLNLVVNARDAMPKGGKLTIETGERELDRAYISAEHLAVEPGRYVALSVSDTGSGMDRETQSRIFEPFFSTKGPGKGTGLGLSTVHGIVHQSGGHIGVQSELGAGTTFVVYLPRKSPSPQPAEREPPAASLRGSETILLVEDEEQVRHLLCTVLRRHGYQVLAAETSGDALLISEQHPGPIELLLTDVVMPRTSGRQLWERLAPLRPDMKVLFMSGYTDDAVVRHGVQSSELGFIQKPVSPATLLAKLRAVLDPKP
jgi:signal transduction histidine kinase/CheY-like chemotaxis protein